MICDTSETKLKLNKNPLMNGYVNRFGWFVHCQRSAQPDPNIDIIFRLQ